MKPIKINEEEKKKLFDEFVKQFNNEIDNFAFNSDKSFSVKTNISTVAKEKVIIMYSQEAYLRMLSLVQHFSTEVAWYGLVDRVTDKFYRVYDVKLCKQYVDGAKVDTEDEDALKFFESLSDDEISHLHYQAHSHVNMGTGASATDLQNQEDIVRSMGKTGYYIFQIWNKKGDISTYLYDLDNNVFYDSKDVITTTEDSIGTIDDFINEASKLVVEKKAYPYQQQGKPFEYYSLGRWDW